MAMAIGLGSMDMPVPSVAEWEWLNWRFPRAVHAGDTIFARWTLTQKRPPAREAVSSIVVWRVDVHKTDGTLCAEGEVGAKIKRHAVATTRSVAMEPDGAASSGATATGPRRRRRRRTGTNGHAPEAAAPPQPAPAKVQPVNQGNQAAVPAKRRRRRRAPASGAARDGVAPAPAATSTVPAPQPQPSPEPASKPGAPPAQNPLGRVISRLRRS